MKLNIISFLFGLLVNIVDDINDFKIKTEWKKIFEFILIAFTIFILYFNKLFRTIGSFVIFIGGIIGLLFAPHIVEAPIWKVIILLSIPSFFYTVNEIWKIKDEISILDINNSIYVILPIIILSTLFSLIEDKYVPEETGYKKLFDRIFQCIIVIFFLYYIPKIKQEFNLSDLQINGLKICGWGWLGYVICSVFIIMFLIIKEKELIN